MNSFASSPVGQQNKVWKRFKENRGATIGLIVIGIFTLLAVFPSLFTSAQPDQIFSGHLRLSPLSEGHLLGTDDVGRDLLTRLVYGTRVSLGVGLLVVIFSSSIGIVLGLIAGYFGGRVDRIIMRLVDMIMALPSILLAIFVVSILGPGLFNAICAVSIVALPAIIRVTRSAVINEKAKDYVTAAASLGASHSRILLKNILPNCISPIIVQATLSFSDGILNTAALGFLGLGAQPPTAEWGTMLSDARPYIESNPWMVTLPGLGILFVVLAFNLIGDGLRDAFDPKL